MIKFSHLVTITENALLYLPAQIRLPIGGERVMCRGSKLTNSGNNNMDFRLARDQVVLLETAEKL